MKCLIQNSSVPLLLWDFFFVDHDNIQMSSEFHVEMCAVKILLLLQYLDLNKLY